ncbi:MAG TPA: hypothetical protein VMV76_07055 [Dehalococcoidia bacterium]|jgi:hypothetical protein|nr:hypothetical protein [Dehalococcoidia bacterium]
MAVTANSTITEVLSANPKAKEIIAKHAGQPVDDSHLSMATGMTIQQVAGYIGWNQEKIDALVKDLNKS